MFQDAVRDERVGEEKLLTALEGKTTGSENKYFGREPMERCT